MVKQVKKIGDYLLLKTIGKGTFGKVKLAVNENTLERVAVKVIEKNLILRHNSNIEKEIRNLATVTQHPNIIRLHTVLQTEEKYYVVLELASKGELFKFITAEKGIPEPFAHYFFRQMVAGIQFCHAHGVVHRDLKPENMLISATNCIKICDFGFSKAFAIDGEEEDTETLAGGPGGPHKPRGQSLMKTSCGTPLYAAPELYHNRLYDGKAVDVWSLGVILFAMLSGFMPVSEATPRCRQFQYLAAHNYNYPPWNSNVFSPASDALLKGMLEADPAHRWTIQQVRESDWVQGVGFAALPYEEPSISESPAQMAVNSVLQSPQKTSDQSLTTETSSSSRNSEPSASFQDMEICDDALERPTHSIPNGAFAVSAQHVNIPSVFSSARLIEDYELTPLITRSAVRKVDKTETELVSLLDVQSWAHSMAPPPPDMSLQDFLAESTNHYSFEVQVARPELLKLLEKELQANNYSVRGCTERWKIRATANDTNDSFVVFLQETTGDASPACVLKFIRLSGECLAHNVLYGRLIQTLREQAALAS